MNQILNELVSKGVQFSTVDGQLRLQLGKATITPEETAALKAGKQEIIDELNGRKVACLSNAQERLWFLSELGHSEQYHILGLVKINGQLEVEALQNTLNYIVQRHEGLRTFFKPYLGNPIQWVQPDASLPIQYERIIELPADQKDSIKQELIEGFSQQPFSLESAPLIRVLLIEEEKDQYVLGICMHHIISDGWSIGILIKEISEVYDAEINNTKLNHELLPIQYADYAAWQQYVTTDEKLKKEVEYWKEHLQDYEDLDLPSDYKRPAQLSGKGAVVQLKLGEKEVTDLREKCLNTKVTFYAALMTAVYALLERYTSQKNFCIGMPVSNRNKSDLEGIVGFFVNTLVVKLSNSKDQQSAIDLLQLVHQTIIDSQDRKTIPFDRIVEEIKPERNLSRSPVFQVLVNHSKVNNQVLKFGNCQLEVVNPEHNVTKFDLTFNFNELPNGEILIAIEYSTDLFHSASVRRMGEHLVKIVHGLVNQSDEPYENINLLNEQEQLNLITGWNQTSFDAPNACLHDLVESRAKDDPNAIAVSFDSEQLTYGELNEQSTQLGIYLQEKGVQSNLAVGLCMDRSLNMIIGMLGILKSGGTYVPLAPDYPADRLNYIIEDSGIHWVLASDQIIGKLQEVIKPSIDLISIEEMSKDHSIDAKEIKDLSSPDDLAYIIYTSGTTGVPKGVKIRHAAIVNETSYYSQAFGFDGSDSQLLLANYIFDASVEQIFVPLISGSTLVLMPQEDQLDGRLLESVLHEKEITHIQATPSLIKTITPGAYSQLKRVCAGGEACPADLALQWSPFVKFYNKYGPTEATVNSSYYPFDPKKSYGSLLPIGKPIGNTQLYILDKNLNPVAVGVKGELYISGAGVSPGYQNKEELTNTRFIDNPFIPETKMYKTGDMARWTPDGNVMFLGRSDEQVKVRGYRIELEEIENVIATHPQVNNNAVIIKEYSGVNQLIAYYTTDESPMQQGDLKAYLKQKLPEYMIPFIFIECEEIPLTPNGKTDRKSLKNRSVNLEGTKTYVAPDSEIERGLADIWKSLLTVGKVGLNDNFFELGGHSLLTTQLLSRINQQFKVSVPLKRLFAADTLADMAQLIENGEAYDLPSLHKMERSDKIPLSFAQERLWFLDKLGFGNQYHMPGVVRIHGDFEPSILEKVINRIIKRHENLRTRFIEEDGQVSQVIDESSEISVTVKGLTANGNVSVSEDLIQEFFQKSFSLNNLPLIRVMVIKSDDQTNLLAVCMHHIISDGWSVGILIKEISELYNSYINNSISSLSPLPIQYADYAVWQREVFTEKRLAKELEYWKKQLAGYEDLELPLDFTRPAQLSGVGEWTGLTLESNTVNALRRTALDNKTTMFGALITGVYVLLRKYTGQIDINLGTPVANRSQQQIEDLVGLFLNTLILRINPIDTDISHEELLREVNRVIRDSQGHQDLPFEKIVEEIQPDRKLNRSPLFQVMVNHTVVRKEALNFGKGRVEIVEADYNVTKFDLTFNFNETEDGTLYIAIIYSADLFAKASMERMGEHLINVLESLAFKPAQSVHELELLTTKEKTQLLQDWNDTDYKNPDKTLHALFAEKVQVNSDHTAVIYNDQTITYGELQQQSTQLAIHLQKLGVKPDQLIGICMERSIDMIVGILGILKSGGAYVPIAPDHPNERVTYLINDSGIHHLLLGKGLKGKMEESGVTLPRQTFELEEVKDKNYYNGDWENVATTNHLAYIIYTSGSTGVPKGVKVAHKSIVNEVSFYAETFRFDKNDRQLLMANYIFDASVEQIFLPLISGSTLVIIPNEYQLDGKVLEQILEEKEITHFQATPSLIKTITPGAYSTLKRVCSGGEACPTDLAGQWSEFVQFYNKYGPTETSVNASYYPYDPANQHNSILPIGKPIGNTLLYILGSNLDPVPIGARGELYISGEGVSQGYQNQPELTAEKFLPNPFKPGYKIYKTGDMARWRADGNIEFLGRVDDQVKVRGYRIETGEVESTLNAFSKISNGVVVAHDHKESTHLIAYYTTNEAHDLTTEIKEYFRDHVPDYMVPSAFVKLDTMPLTPNGKTDVKALKKLKVTFESSAKYVAAETDVERGLVEVWKEALEVEKVGINDNFFDLGGHSLMATQIIASVNKTFKTDIPLMKLFEDPTIKGLAKIIEESEEVIQKNELTDFAEGNTELTI